MHDWLFTNLGTFTWGSVEYAKCGVRRVENKECGK